MTGGTPSAHWQIDEALVRRLLREQHPDLAKASLKVLDSGWDNETFRLGEHLVVRLPRRQKAVALLEREQVWLPKLARSLPIAVPVPERIGKPTAYYPCPWSILPWLPGKTADLEAPGPKQAPRLARFLRALHQPAPVEAPRSPVRGVDLCLRAAVVEERLQGLRGKRELVTGEILEAWRRALAAPKEPDKCWLHGDLHARNVLVEKGVLTGILDWGDLTAGDVATDLAAPWMLWDDRQTRGAFLEAYQPTEALLDRGIGWAISFAALLLSSGLVDHPRHAAMGARAFRRLQQDLQ
ncbi:MAG: aminoglycoside phosphotransferase family protein [Deltaproteobacteria bacterium]|nr:aminoglycoside phosphotransferase family protein [Deltaproteobacteria bacterium]